MSFNQRGQLQTCLQISFPVKIIVLLTPCVVEDKWQFILKSLDRVSEGFLCIAIGPLSISSKLFAETYDLLPYVSSLPSSVLLHLTGVVF